MNARKGKANRAAPTLTVRVFRPSGFLSGPPLVRCDVLTAPAPFRVARRYFAGQRAGLQVVRALPDGAASVEVVDSQGRQLAAWKPCATGRYTGTHDAPPHFTEWVPA